MKKNGFTVIELMIYVAVSMLIMLAVYAAVSMAMRTSSSLGRKIITQQDARLVLDMMAMDIRNASYNSGHVTGIWLDQNGALLPVDNGLAGIQVANQNNILVEMDLNEDNIIGPPGENEAIFYRYVIADNRITRESNFAGGAQNFFGGVGTGTLIRNNDAVVPLFQYFVSGALDTAILNPTAAQIPLIRKIRITIVADTETNDLNTHAPKRMTYTTDVLVKNHAVAKYTGGN